MSITEPTAPASKPVRASHSTSTTSTTSTAPSASTTTSPSAGSSVSWRTAQPGLWVATGSDGRPLGIVSERWRDGFVTTAVTGEALGRHDTLARAQAALEHQVAARTSTGRM